MKSPEKDEEELADVVDALKAWFQSQDITPGEAIVVAGASIASIIIANAKNWAELNEEISLVQARLMASTTHGYVVLQQELAKRK